MFHNCFEIPVLFEILKITIPVYIHVYLCISYPTFPQAFFNFPRIYMYIQTTKVNTNKTYI